MLGDEEKYGDQVRSRLNVAGNLTINKNGSHPSANPLGNFLDNGMEDIYNYIDTLDPNDPETEAKNEELSNNYRELWEVVRESGSSNRTFRALRNLNVGGDTTIHVQSGKSSVSIKNTSDPTNNAAHLSNSVLHGNLRIQAESTPDSSYIETASVVRFDNLTVGGSAELSITNTNLATIPLVNLSKWDWDKDRKPTKTVIGKDFTLNIERADTSKDTNSSYQNLSTIFSTEQAGVAYSSALLLGAIEGESINTNYPAIHFHVKGSSHIKVGEVQNPSEYVRSAIGLIHQHEGVSLVLGEATEEEKHKTEKFRNKIFLGKNSLIETSSDKSHGIVLGNILFNNGYNHDNNDVYLENKGVIQIAGNASAISGYNYGFDPKNLEYQLGESEPKFIEDSEWKQDSENPALYSTNNPDGKRPKKNEHLQNPELSLFISFARLRNYLSEEIYNKTYNPEVSNSKDAEEMRKLFDYLAKNFDANQTMIEINNTGRILAPKGYIFSGSEFRDQFNSQNGELAGKLVLNNGNDEVTLAQTDLTALTELNGAQITGRAQEIEKQADLIEHFSEGVNKLVLTLPQAVNTLNLDQDLTGSSNVEGSANNTKIANWDIINLGKNANATLTLTGDLHDGWGELAKAENFKADQRKQSFNIEELGTIALNNNLEQANLEYNVTNAGKIDLTQNDQSNNSLTITGNYEGKNGQLLVDSTWNNSDQQTNDKLVIKGNASGKTQVITKAGIIGDITLSDNQVKNGKLASPVVVIEGQDTDAFVGKAATTNAGEAQLVRSEVNGKIQYHWTLGLVEKDKEIEFINDLSTAYVQAVGLTKEIGFMQLGRLNQRIGQLVNSNQPETWLRTRTSQSNLQGDERFGSKASRYLLQIGQDLNVAESEDSLSRVGVMFSYANAKQQHFDKFKAENGEIIGNKQTANSTLKAYSLGAYFSHLYHDSAYIDLVANLSKFDLHYNAEKTAKQSGYGVGASIEAGYPIVLQDGWLLEPQAQLSYQHVKLSAFNDGIRQVKGMKGDALRARLGGRLVWNNSLYLAANLHYDLLGNKTSASIGRSVINESYSKLFGELTLGGQIDIQKNVQLYGSLNYKRSLSGNNNHVFRQDGRSLSETSAELGIKVRF